MIFPTRDIIIRHNRLVITETIGFFSPPDNLLHPASLEWVLEVIQYPLFGINRYPSLVEKAAIIAWTIITKHVFFDGNKRTGTFAMETFLNINRHQLNASTDEVVGIALRIANYREENYGFEDFTQWVSDHISISH